MLARADSEIGFFRQVFVDIGDHQSLSQSLSSFTAHLARVRSFLELADRATLVLIDEIASGTDPLEGAALARALLEAFTERGSALAITTHYEFLKELGAAEGERYLNASFGFDFESLEPTYRLTVGIPGVSSALTVAEISGLSKDIVERARSLLPDTVRREGELLQRLEEERRTVEKLKADAAADQRQSRALLADLERRKAGFEFQERERLAREAKELTREVEQARQKLREVRGMLEKRAEPADITRAERLVTEASHSVSIGGRLTQAVRAKQQRVEIIERAPSADELTLGQRVHYTELGVDVEILRPAANDRVQVLAGKLRLQVALADLRIKAASKPLPLQAELRGQARARTVAGSMSGGQPIRTTDTTCDLRGMIVEDALAKVDQHIDQLLQSSEPGGFVLHGHGTGALKQAVRQHLRKHTHIEKFAPAERDDGGDALTVFWFKG